MVRIDWPALYARLMAGAGYTPAEIDSMPVQDAAALLRHWRTCPPPNETLAAVVLKPNAPLDIGDPSGIGGLITRYPDGLVK